ncbi:ribosome maturation factor RimM [Wenxinia saemankumensis]|uniref:Ribosome maturation factor RimM n=1 Tax=Wenxinia saemankumensis TaxID=1447782 RepID=A0A1M6GT24_9RHOB|nr:ribosome maturation factor RimM [Wenxinia saemankumensis]SHJ13115.1 16S rRNA processing protein RimM [Wenxinia saemankumensis]
MQDKVIVGAIGGAFGVHGEVRLKSFCAQPEAIAAYAPLTDASGRSYPAIRLTGATKGALTARIDGIATREEAEALKGTQLYAERARLPEPDEEEYYHSDLEGLTVVDTGGAEIGTVRAVQNHGAGDLLEIAVPGRSATLLLPFTMEVVPAVDLAAGRLVVDPPEGAL